MKEIKLKVVIDYDFDLYGITSSYKDYKLAWIINNALHLSLIKVEDHTVYLSEVKEMQVSCFEEINDDNKIRLLSNKVYKQQGQTQEYLIPELKHFDYFLLNEGHDNEVTNFTNKLKQLNGLEFITKIDVMKLRSRENLLF